MSAKADDKGFIDSSTFNLPFENIDTDQIIPAQFLTTTQRDGLGKFCFYHWRFQPDGSARGDSPLAGYSAQDQRVLVTGTNFGCGSSREHAPWALLDLGFRAVISTRFADIFRNNSSKNGLLLVTVSEPVAEYLLANPNHRVRIDIRAARLEIPGFGNVDFPLDAFAAHCLAEGIDQLDFILQHEKDIARHEQRAPL